MTDARGDESVRFRISQLRPNGCEQLLRYLFRSAHFYFGQQNRELIATEARWYVRDPEVVPQDIGHRHQYIVPDRMPACIVDLLEVVEVENRECAAALVASYMSKLPRELFGKALSVEEFGEGVVLNRRMGGPGQGGNLLFAASSC